MTHWLQKLFASRAPTPEPGQPASVPSHSSPVAMAPVPSSADERRRGNAHLDRGDLQAAIACYQRAVALDPESVDAQIGLGFALQQAGQPSAALSSLMKARERQPRNFDAAYLAGQVCMALNQPERAVGHFQQALDVQPGFEPLYGELCQALFQNNDPARAESMIDSGIQRFPHNASFRLFLGNLHFHRKAWRAAKDAYAEALRLHADLPQAHGNLGTIFQNEEDWSAAIVHFDKALRMDGRQAEFHTGRATCLLQLGQLDAALQGFLRALALAPNAASVHQNLGLVYMHLQRRTEAETHTRRALSLNPDDANAHSNLGALQASQGKFPEAERSFEQACALAPTSGVFRSNLGGSLVRQGRLPEAIDCFRQAMALDPLHIESGDNLLLALSADPGTSNAEYVEQARAVGLRLCAAGGTPFSQWPKAMAVDGPLKVGLISSDLCNGAVGYFLEGVVRHVDKSQLQLMAYDTGATTDALSERMRPGFSEWHHVFGLTPRAIADRIHANGVHILIDLNGHAGGNSLPVFALKPAPLQISWLGYWASTGLPAMDFVIADIVCAPPGTDGDFTEKVYRMPHTRHCFTPPLITLPVGPSPALRNGYITFGSFQSLTKIHGGVLAAWGRILQAVPSARLNLTSHQVSDAAFQQSFREKLRAAGIDPSRVKLGGPLPREQYLASHAQVDILLDTFPYTGGTTTCEALWMGVPTVTLRGHNMIGRQGASMLGCVGLQEWIAEDVDDYVAKAAAHAADPEALQALRRTLRDRAVASPLFDALRFARDWETALLSMWKDKAG